MTHKSPTLSPKSFLAWACLTAVFSLNTAFLKADSNPLMNAPKPTPEATDDANPNDDTQQEPVVLGQWNDVSSTHNSLNRIVENLSEDKGHMVDRKEVHYPGDGKASREITVRSNLKGKGILSDVKERWDRAGNLTYRSRQNNTLNADGVQVGGERITSAFTQGLVTREIAERWDPDFKGWLETSVSTEAYYDNGDLRQRITEEPAFNRKTQENWGSLGLQGRKKTTRLWNKGSHRWLPA
jgi:hypothetical protein